MSLLSILTIVLLLQIISPYKCLTEEAPTGSWFVEEHDGICQYTHRERISRYVPYIETYRRKVLFWLIKTRYNYRWEEHIEVRNERRCCPGYSTEHERFNTFVCTPICDRECVHGTCILPQQCSCNAGYVFSITHGEQICVPQCLNNCTNGICIEPNTCACNEGYTLLNDGYTCIPHCDTDCTSNSICIEPNKCECDHGYKSVPALKPNGITLIVICEPICSSCSPHSECIAPNICRCLDGYIEAGVHYTEEFLTTHTTILPMIFTCQPYCQYSCDENQFCAAPNKCECLSGYEFANKKFKEHETPSSCVPICEPPCGIRGQCILPDVCSCKDGWELSSEFHNCIPHCDQFCGDFALCTAPNKCECEPGYTFKSLGNESNSLICIPICEKKCINGFCASPNMCQCNEGYILDIYDGFKCNPSCGEWGCTNGICTSPGKCTCDPDYVINTENNMICDPICENCTNGTCIAPFTCICNYGYKKNEDNQCKPYCYNNCMNGTCIAPNQCECNEGYVLNINGNNYYGMNEESNICIPYCELNCTNGSCTSPNICTCNYGYEMNEENYCIPSCDGRCQFGNCIAPGQCLCMDGYIATEDLLGAMCKPYCDFDCINGKCLSPSTCECDHGYTIDSSNQSLCIAVCDGGCGYGDCVAPNECECHAGYAHRDNITLFESDRSQQPVACVNPCSNECGTHGICNVEDKTCDCNYGWTGENCNIVYLCGIIRNAKDEDLLQWIAIKNETNGNVTSLQAVNWHGPICNEKCILDKSTECFYFETLATSYTLNSTFVCLLDSASWCNSIDLQASNHIYGGIAATIILIIAIAGSAIVIFLIIKRRRQQNSGANPTKCDNLLEQSEATDSLLTVESTYL